MFGLAAAGNSTSLTLNGSTTSTAGNWFSTTIDTANMEPGKLYYVTVSGAFAGGNVPFVALQCAPPIGYVVEIDGMERMRSETPSPDHTYTVRLLGGHELGFMAAGSCSQLLLGRIYWQVGLGGLRNGQAAGSISIVDPGLSEDWSTLYTPASLQYESPSDEITVIRDAGHVLRQVIANQCVVDIVTVSTTSYDLKFYHSGLHFTHPNYVVGQTQGQVTSGTGLTARAFAGDPYLSYRVAQDGSTEKLKITATIRDVSAASGWTAGVARTVVTSLERVDTGPAGAPTYDWTRKDWNSDGEAQVAKQFISSAGTVADRTDTMVVQPGAGGTSATSLARTYHKFTWGEEITSVIAGSSNPNQTSYQYYDNPVEVGRHGFVKSTASSGGSWEAYDYWDSTSTVGTKKTGTLRYRYRPFTTSAPTVAFNALVGEVTTYAYSDDPFGIAARPSSVATRVNNILTAQSDTTYVTLPGLVNGAMVVAATRTDRTASGNNPGLVTITRFYPEDTASHFLRGQIHSRVRPDNVKVSYAYQRGNWSAGTFSPSSGGLASRVATITGTTGTAYTTYETYTVDPLALVSGKSTLETVIRDERALVVRTESYVWLSTWKLISWVNYTYNTFGNLTGTTASNGATTTANYAGNQKLYEIDESGIRTDFLYTAAGQLWKAQKRNSDNSAFTTTTTYGYDAAGRLLAQTVSGAGTTETVSISREYDDAGRLWRESSSGLAGLTVHAYGYSSTGWTHTVTAPDTSDHTETYFIDGRLKQVEGSAAKAAVVAAYYDYSVNSLTGQRLTQVNYGSPASARYTKTWTDWVGRTIKTEQPGFQSAQNLLSVTQNFYDDPTVGKGRLFKTTRSGYAPGFFEYDELGQLKRSGLDLSLPSNGLTTASTDRITEQNQYVETYDSALWLTTEQKIYPTTAGAITASITRTRLTGYDALPGRRAETRSWSIEDLSATTAAVTTTVDVNTGAKTVTTTTTTAGLPNAAIATVTNGLATTLQTSDGLTYSSLYDKLERLEKTKDPRHTTGTGNAGYTVYHYLDQTILVDTITDPAGKTVVTNHYDSRGRVDWTRNADGKYVRTAYNYRGQLQRQWGDATYPVEYGYNGFGERTSLSTYRGASSADSNDWPTVGTADVTQWVYDAASGLPWKKIDAVGTPDHTVEFGYNVRGQIASRKWARKLTAPGYTTQPVTTSYGYYEDTGELNTVSYNDEVETDPLLRTPDVTYTYDRLGRVATVDEKASEGGIGTRTFNYDSTKPWRALNEVLPASFYASRVLTRLYEETTSPGGTYGTQKGRMAGMELGITGNTGRDLRQVWRFSNQPRFAGVSASTNGGTAVDFTYAYKGSSTLLDGYNQGTFTVSRDYETNRDLVTRLESKYGSGTPVSLARYDYKYDDLGRRTSVSQSGAAYAAYTAGQSYSAVYHRYGYNSRDELESDKTYGGNNPELTTNELPGRRLEYRFDSIGNRKSSGVSGTGNSSVDTSGTGDDEYQTNELNQIMYKENNLVSVTGTVASNASVAVLGTVSTMRVDNAWANPFMPDNGTAAATGSTTAFAAVSGSTSPIRALTSQWAVPKRKQAFAYDNDGNLTSDDLWTYKYDAENRLVRMISTLSPGQAPERWQLDFKYDYLGRRIAKTVTNLDPAHSALNYARRFVYDGWNLLAEIDATTPATILRSYTWGLDLTGDLARSGGVGALLRITHYTSGVPGSSYHPTYDGNGNITALVNAGTGALAAIYEYDPFGQPIRNEVIDTAVADAPFRFSTKYTDIESGLVYYGLRYYSPSLGRFINRDPIGEKGGFNLYGFCGNNGVNAWDYLGLDVIIYIPKGDGYTGGSLHLEPMVISAEKNNALERYAMQVQAGINSMYGLINTMGPITPVISYGNSGRGIGSSSNISSAVSAPVGPSKVPDIGTPGVDGVGSEPGNGVDPSTALQQPAIVVGPNSTGAAAGGSGGSALGNLLRNVPFLGGTLGAVGDVVSGVGNVALGVASFGQSGTFGRGLGQVGGGVNVFVTDAAAGAFGLTIGKVISVGYGVGNLLTANKLANNPNDPAREDRGFFAGVSNFVRSVVIPTYGLNLGANLGSPQQGFVDPSQARYFNNIDRVSYIHDRYQNNRDWVRSAAGQVPAGVTDTGPIGGLISLIGAPVFWLTPSRPVP